MEFISEWKGRMQYWLDLLTQDFYTAIQPIQFEGFTTCERLSYEEAMKQEFRPMPEGTRWGHQYEYAWFRAKIVLPREAEGEKIVMSLDTGNGGWPGGESVLYVNGREFGTKRADFISIWHHYVQDNILTEQGAEGTCYELVMETYTGHHIPMSKFGMVAVGPVKPEAFKEPDPEELRSGIGSSSIGIWNETAHQLWLDAVTLYETMQCLDDNSLRAAKIADALKKFTYAVDFEQPLDKRMEDYRLARGILKPMLEAKNGSTAPVMYAIGNAHLDIMWLWPYAETIRKTARTFAQQLRLLEMYPEYKFLQSQPQLYQICKENYPELYARMKEAVKRGQWICEGGMWVEPDTNMASGESLIRQLVHGMRFYKEEFDVDCEILWLPDTFGYSAVLPQILKDCGIRYLFTQKIFWSCNEGEKFPYHYFTWQGMDGSKVISFLSTSYTYHTNPRQLIEVWNNRVQKEEPVDKFLLPFGYGDGGGGPSRDFIEYGLREENLEGVPRFRFAHPLEFFQDMEKEGAPEHTYLGELYFTAHRGVYTSQAAVKLRNRKSELALRESELWSAIAGVRKVFSYPAETMDRYWKLVLLNQFHDILPGSSIARVYEDVARTHLEVMEGAALIAQEARGKLTERAEGAVTVFNSLSWERTGIVVLPGQFKQGAMTAEGRFIYVYEKDGEVIAEVTVPSCGVLALIPVAPSQGDTARDTAEDIAGNAASDITKAQIISGVQKGMAVQTAVTPEGAVLENGYVRVVFNANGEITSYRMKSTGREYAAQPMNQFLLYKDVPRYFDAWDIDSPYEKAVVNLEPKAEISISCAVPVYGAVCVKKQIGNSSLEQIIGLSRDSHRVTFDTTVDWKELHRLLKVSFPVNVLAEEGINEIQFGYVTRPTHRSRQYDRDRFEVCNHRYTALCEQNHGAAVLNDCKYGVSMLDHSINLTLLRAPASPQMRADNEIHRFTYAFTAWEGSFMDSDVVREGYELNVPLETASGLASEQSFFSVDQANIMIETVKPAEDGSDTVVLRMYEAKKAGTRCAFRSAFPILKAYEGNMLEKKERELPATAHEVELDFRPFEIKTILLKLE
ncbi:alpha-mannosidase [Anaerotaenia torta]|uniref:alpha-mannosidase n=1 Tax=Anaerotaenia torta TaxID=433293 RepID=UPI003D196304